jgi:hypothetical protein
MTPQKQTIFTDEKNGINGNCFTACIASLFDLPIDQVPHFSSHGENWFKVFYDFLKTTDFEINGTWHIPTNPKWKSFKGIDGYVIVGGKFPRGTKNGHSVIYKDGEPFFDPHPDNNFLLIEEDVYLIERRSKNFYCAEFDKCGYVCDEGQCEKCAKFESV